MLKWTEYAGETMAKYPFQGGPFVSVALGDDGWTITFRVGPTGTYAAPSRAKAIAWVERFVDARAGRDTALGRAVASPGLSFMAGHPSSTHISPEDQARYDAFSASYVPPKRPARRAR
jgi:hypothetical protein